MITLNTTIKKFTHAVQLADIHIRLTQRHDEYREVFDRFYRDLKETPESTVVFVVGDVVHNKTDLSPECVRLVKEFLFNLAETRTTVLVGGNHDATLSNKNRLDSLTPIVEALDHPNLFYLQKSGLYALGNICINNYSIYDSPEKYIKGSDIPQIYRNQFEHVIALYHGTVDNAMTDFGFKMVNKTINVTTFDDHDLVLMGDIHLRQDLQTYSFEKNKPYIHYCGSLIQQNHGEKLGGHGYTFWNLEDRQRNCIDVPNDYGYFTVVVENGKVISSLDNLPKKVRIQFQLSKTLLSEVDDITNMIRQKVQVIEVVFGKTDNTLSPTNNKTVQCAVGDVNNQSYQENLIKEYLKEKHGASQELIDSVIELHQKTYDQIKKDNGQNSRWIPIKFEWENLFSYGDGNVVDFTKLHDVVGLFASNASGKSTFLSALSMCIFDKCERENKAANILNIQRDTFKCKFEFEVNGERHFIEREGKSDKKGNVKVDVEFWKVQDGKRVDLNGEQRRNTNELIREKLGTYEDFLLTAMSVQGGKNTTSIIDMGHTERKDLLAQFLGLSVFDRLYEKANKDFNKVATLFETYKNDPSIGKLNDYTNFLSQAESAYRVKTEELEKITKQREYVQQRIVTVSSELIKLDSNIPNLETSQKKKTDAEKKIENLNREITSTNFEIEKSAKELEEVEGHIKNLEEKKYNDVQVEYQSLKQKQTEYNNKFENLKIRATNELDTIKRLEEHKYNPNCEVCMANSEHILKAKADANTKLEQYKTEGAGLKASLNDVSEKIKSLSWIEEAMVQMKSFVMRQNNAQKTRIRLLDTLNTAQKTINTQQEIVRQCERDIELFNKHVESIQANDVTNKIIAELKEELAGIESNYKTENRTLNDLNGKISVCKNQIQEVHKKIQLLKDTEQQYTVYEIYTQAVNRDGIPFDVIMSVVPEIEREVNSILSQITVFTAKFETDGKNVIPYIVYDDRKWLMGLTSGFERFALSLAIRVALTNISNLPKPNFLVIDEGFGVLDAENLASMQLLFSHLKTHFDFILIISHLEALRDMVDMHIEIVKDNGFSKINFP